VSGDFLSDQDNVIGALIIFTLSYPYDGASEQTFLGRELPYLTQYFDNIILVPKRCRGKQVVIPERVVVNTDFAAIIAQASKLNLLYRALLSPQYYQEIFSNPALLFFPRKMLKLIKMAGRASLTRNWVSEWLQTLSLNKPSKDAILYTYWFDEVAVGVGLAKNNFPSMKFISRAHGYDIYEDRPPYFYWPFRKRTLASLDKLFLASYAASNYMRTRYPAYLSKYETFHLGVENPGFLSSPSKDGIFRIVSCARIVPLKRIDLLLRGIDYAARLRPRQKFEWHHFGEGLMRDELQRFAKKLPANVKAYLPGFVMNEDIMLHYQENPVDVFISVSKTEGGAPVSITEAASCGIPIIGTNVGGTPEVVSDKNGLLLESDPSSDEIAHAFFELLDNPRTTMRMRKESRQVWRTQLNAKNNFSAFASYLNNLLY